MVTVFIFFIHLLDKLSLPYLEKSSFTWEILKDKKPTSKKTEIVILGDSQVLGGIHPKLMETYLLREGKSFTYFYNPKPSEQLEGIYFFLLKYIATRKIQPKLIIWNVSPIHFSKNGFTEANKKLFFERGEWSKDLIFDSNLRKFYFPKEIDLLRYFLMQIIPFQKVSSLINMELSFIPKSLNLNLQSKDLENYLSHNPFESLKRNKWRNELILKSIQENFGYVDWNLDENLEHKECFVSSFQVPREAKFAFSNPRSSSYEVLKKIVELLTKLNIYYKILVIPFSPSSEKIFNNFSENSPFGLAARYWEKELPQNWVFIHLEESDYGDYIHPNFCGAKKITQFIVEKILLKE